MKIFKEARCLLAGGRSFFKILFSGSSIRLKRDETEKCFTCGRSLYYFINGPVANAEDPVYVCVKRKCKDFGQSVSGIPGNLLDPSKSVLKAGDKFKVIH